MIATMDIFFEGHFVVMKTGCYPLKTRLKLFFKWGIKFEEAYAAEEQAERKVLYADRAELETEILKKFPQEAEPIEFENDEVEIRKYSEDIGLPYEFIKFSRSTV